MHQPTIFRLNALRAMYLLVAVGLAIYIWPLFLKAPHGVEHMRGVVLSVLVAVSLLALLGVRYPLQMIPLLLFELLWKTLWIVGIGLPLWRAGVLDGPEAQTMFDNLLGLVLIPLALPWRYVIARYLVHPADPWRRAPAVPGAAVS